MQKDYKEWMIVKSELNNKNQNNKYFKERDVWWTSTGENIGSEEDGKGERFLRPILVLKKFNHNLLMVVPLSTTEKEGDYYFKFKIRDIMSNALLSQIKSIDSSRLAKKIGMISKDDFQIIKNKIINFFN